MATQLISKAELKTYLDFSGTGEDNLLDEIIEHVSAQIEVYCDRLFAEETDRNEYPRGGTDALHLKLFPITSINTIKEDPQRQFGANTLVDDSEYYSAGDAGARGLVIRQSTWRRELSGQASIKWIGGADTIQVIYTGGYTVTSGVTAVPDDLKKAVIRQASYLWDRRATLGTVSASGGDGSASFICSYDLLPEVKTSLQPYRRLS